MAKKKITKKEIFKKISQERTRQVKKWGKQSHDLAFWLNILGEEYGEACKANVEWRFLVTQWAKGKLPNDKFEKLEAKAMKEIETELIQVAALAASIIESIHNGES